VLFHFYKLGFITPIACNSYYGIQLFLFYFFLISNSKKTILCLNKQQLSVHSYPTPNHILPSISLCILIFTLPVLIYPTISQKLSIAKSRNSGSSISSLNISCILKQLSHFVNVTTAPCKYYN